MNADGSNDLVHTLCHKLANVDLEGTDVTISDHDLSASRNRLFSPHYDECLQAARVIRKYTSRRCQIDTILSLDILGQLRHLLVTKTMPDLQFECVWAVTNIVAGTMTHTQQVVDAGLVDPLVNCLLDCNLDWQAAWALANIACDLQDLREFLFSHGIIPVVVDLLFSTLAKGKNGYKDGKALLWILETLCIGGFNVNDYWESYLLVLEALTTCLENDDHRLWPDACSALSSVFSCMREVDEFFDVLPLYPCLISRVLDLLSTKRTKMMLPALRLVGALTIRPNEYIKLLLNQGLVNSVQPLLTPAISVEVRYVVLLIISNLAGGNEQDIQHAQRNHTIMTSVLGLVKVPDHTYCSEQAMWIPIDYETGDSWKLTSESLWILYNLSCQSKDESLLQVDDEKMRNCSLCIHSNLLYRYPTLPVVIARLLRYTALPLRLCLRGLDTVQNIISCMSRLTGHPYHDSRSVSCPSLNSAPFVHTLIEEDIMSTLQELCEIHPIPELTNIQSTIETFLRDPIEPIVRPASRAAHRRPASLVGTHDLRLIENRLYNLDI